MTNAKWTSSVCKVSELILALLFRYAGVKTRTVLVLEMVGRIRYDRGSPSPLLASPHNFQKDLWSPLGTPERRLGYNQPVQQAGV